MSDSIEEIIARDDIAALLKKLSYRERMILEEYYGIVDGYSFTLEEMGRRHKVTRERIRQIRDKGIRKLQDEARRRHMEG